MRRTRGVHARRKGLETFMYMRLYSQNNYLKTPSVSPCPDPPPPLSCHRSYHHRIPRTTINCTLLVGRRYAGPAMSVCEVPWQIQSCVRLQLFVPRLHALAVRLCNEQSVCNETMNTHYLLPSDERTLFCMPSVITLVLLELFSRRTTEFKVLSCVRVRVHIVFVRT